MEWDETWRVHDGFIAWEWFGSLPGTKRALYQLHYGGWSLLSRALTVGENVGAASPVCSKVLGEDGTHGPPGTCTCTCTKDSIRLLLLWQGSFFPFLF